MTATARSHGCAIGNLVGGFVAGLYSVPEGIGYASLAGINPMLGIYSGMVPVAVAAAATGSVLMMSTLTSAIALTMGGVLADGGYTGSQVGQAVYTMALLSGALMIVLGVLQLGKVVNFVSNAVMTGFVMGVAILIMNGKLDDVFGYDPADVTNKVLKAIDILAHPGSWDRTTTAVGLGTIALGFTLKAVPALTRYALVIVVVLGTALVWILDVPTATLADEATIETGLAALPIPRSVEDLPNLALVPGLLVGAASIAVVALAQGASIRPAFPNPDGSPARSSRDFFGQGLGNVVGAFFQSTPTGGSLSRTAVSADSGATRRIAGYLAAASVLVLVLLFGNAVGHIPEAVIGGLLFVIGVELVVGRIPDARLAWRAGAAPRLLLVVTLVLTLTAPLQWAIFGGVILSLLAYVGASSQQARLQRIARDKQGWVATDDIPTVLPGGEPLLLRYTGPNFFAVVAPLHERLPRPNTDDPGVVVLDLGQLQRFSSTMLKQLNDYARRLADAGSAMVLTGITADGRATLARAGTVDLLGKDNILPTDPHISAAIETAFQRGQARLDELSVRPQPSTEPGSTPSQ